MYTPFLLHFIFFVLTSNSIIRILPGNEVALVPHWIAGNQSKESEKRKLWTTALLLIRSP
jgi:hypothetical protein